MRQASRIHAAAFLASRLRTRQEEIERATLDRVRGLSEVPPSSDPEYAEGLRRAVSAAIAYGIEAVEHGERGAPPIPDVLRAQARLAARSGVSLDTVLRRYFAGHSLLEDFLLEEAEAEGELDPAELKRILRSQAALADRLLAAVSDVYSEEANCRRHSAQRRRAERIERLLAGEPLDTADIAYDFGGWHLGMLTSGPGSQELPKSLAGPLQCRLLSVPRPEGTVWAWLAFRRRPDPEEIAAVLPADLSRGCTLALGEPGEGIAGWRLSHRQAAVALPVAQRGPRRAVRYADAATLASVLQDELLAVSLRRLYLEPLETERDGGVALRETLRAYFGAGRNVSSAAVTLGVYRHTVTKRIRIVEERIGRRLDQCAVDLELALALDQSG